MQPHKEGVQGAAPRTFFDNFLSIFGKNVLVLKDRILEHTEFQKTTGTYVTGRPDCSGPSRQEVKIDVWKYLQTIVMGLYAVSEQTLAHSDRVLSRPRCSIEKPLLASFCIFFLQTGKNNMEASIHDTSVVSDSTTTKASTTANRSEVYTDRIIIIRCDYIMNTEKTHLYID